jgi:hypothetical protein
MVKYNHCEKCKKVITTVPWVGEVHAYTGICPTCMEREQKEDSSTEEKLDLERDLESEKQRIVDESKTDYVEPMKNIHESTLSSPLEVEKKLLSRLEQMATEFLSSQGSIDVLIKEINVGLVDKAKERIEETFQSFDVNKIDAQKVVDYVDKTFEYLSEYKDYMDIVVIKLQDNPKMKVKTAIEKVYKETLGNIPKNVAKDVLSNKKTMLKTVFGKAVKYYSIYSDTEDVMELSKQMVLHPFNEIKKRLNTLPFYDST